MNYYDSVNYYHDAISQYYYDNLYHNYQNLSFNDKMHYSKLHHNILYTTMFDCNRSNVIIHHKLTTFFILISAPPFTSRATVSL